jgi:DNA-binding GntR family transcriptional regulator
MKGILEPVKLDNYKPLREVVFDTIREAIIDGRLKPGLHLMETQLAEDLGVSRTPVREAIRKLELEGFVVMIPRKGAYVAGISSKEISSVFEVRRALEELAAELAANRASDEVIEKLERLLVEFGICVDNHDVDKFVELDTKFHSLIYDASGNERVGPMVNLLREHIQRYRMRSLSSVNRIKRALEEHTLIVEALAARDPDLAKQKSGEHIYCAENALMAVISQEEDA